MLCECVLDLCVELWLSSLCLCVMCDVCVFGANNVKDCMDRALCVFAIAIVLDECGWCVIHVFLFKVVCVFSLRAVIVHLYLCVCVCFFCKCV